MSVHASFMNGTIESFLDRLNYILSNATTFDDALETRALKARFLASQENYLDAKDEILAILSHLGEEFPSDIEESQVLGEVKAVQAKLEGVNKEAIIKLKPMVDASTSKKSMRFMGIFLDFSFFASPMLGIACACRMIQMTFELGRCKDSITALAYMSSGMCPNGLFFLHSVQVQMFTTPNSSSLVIY